MNNQKLVIGLFGFGCVGRGLYDVLQKTRSFQATIKTICIKDTEKRRDSISIPFTYDSNSILKDPAINVVVELIDDAEAAYTIVTEALKAGKAVVSANKKMIAAHFEELLELQRVYKKQLLYEAACCAGIPIIRSLEEYYDNDMLQSINGIINGSTNYILTKTIEEKITYANALQQAQEAGYAESNPELDVSGEDARNKLLILIAHAFGVVLNPQDIFTIGIKQISDIEVKYAIEKGYKIKLVAHAHLTEAGNLVAWVMPQFIEAKEKLYHVDDVFNGVATSTYFSDSQFFVGKGAGAYPTASAVLSDLSALSYGYKYEYKKIQAQSNIVLGEKVWIKILLRHNVLYREYFRQFFVHVEEMYQKEAVGYIVGIIEFDTLREIVKQAEAEVSAVLFELAEAYTNIKKLEKSEKAVVLF